MDSILYDFQSVRRSAAHDSSIPSVSRVEREEGVHPVTLVTLTSMRYTPPNALCIVLLHQSSSSDSPYVEMYWLFLVILLMSTSIFAPG